jgi:hypothetical protein
MAASFEQQQIVSFEELLMSEVVQQDTLRRVLVQKGIFTNEEFLVMVREVKSEIERTQKENRTKGDIK